jgi:hypothetical protein
MKYFHELEKDDIIYVVNNDVVEEVVVLSSETFVSSYDEKDYKIVIPYKGSKKFMLTDYRKTTMIKNELGLLFSDKEAVDMYFAIKHEVHEEIVRNYENVRAQLIKTTKEGGLRKNNKW